MRSILREHIDIVLFLFLLSVSVTVVPLYITPAFASPRVAPVEPALVALPVSEIPRVIEDKSEEEIPVTTPEVEPAPVKAPLEVPPEPPAPPQPEPEPVAVAPALLTYTFNKDGTLFETGKVKDSSSPYFWVTSGGELQIKGGVGKTIQNQLSADDRVRLIYKAMNPLDTAEGYTPQNTFRMVTKATWGNVDETILFRIAKTNLTNTPNRDGYSGIFLMGRYRDANNLYYVGIRHDGQAVIKKKINGAYHTLGHTQAFGEQSQYHKWSKPNLLPQNQWVGLRARFENLANGSVRIRMYLDAKNSGAFKEIVTVTDAGIGGPAHTGNGSGGIRTDFMDVEFDNYDVRAF